MWLIAFGWPWPCTGPCGHSYCRLVLPISLAQTMEFVSYWSMLRYVTSTKESLSYLSLSLGTRNATLERLPWSIWNISTKNKPTIIRYLYFGSPVERDETRRNAHHFHEEWKNQSKSRWHGLLWCYNAYWFETNERNLLIDLLIYLFIDWFRYATTKSYRNMYHALVWLTVERPRDGGGADGTLSCQ